MKPQILHSAACLFALTLGLFSSASRAAHATPEPADVLQTMERVGDWQINNPDIRRTTGWIHAAYTLGVMELANLSAQPRYFEAMLNTSRANAWQLGPRPYHADDHAIGQLYLAIYARERDPVMLSATRARFDTILASPINDNLDYDQAKNPGRSDRWSWCDALFMAPATWIGLSRATGNKAYLDYAVDRWWHSSDYLYDKDAHLYYRDGRFFTEREANGEKIFWGRGNGWVMGALVRVLQDLPMNHPSRPRFEQQFREMCIALLALQKEDGLWRASLLDPDNYPLKETSGSGFFCYAFAWGINQGLLDRERFLPATLKTWRALVECVTPEGKLTHVQPVGGSPKNFPPDSTEEYAVGAFLLAGSELYRLAIFERVQPAKITVSNPAADMPRLQETVEIDRTAPGLPAGPCVVMDGLATRVIASQELALAGADGPKTLLFQVDLAPGEERTYFVIPASALAAVPVFPAKTHARFVPERKDDFAWENDHIAFRMYGPALKKETGDDCSGIDVWGKRTRRLVVDSWYNRNYHEDTGEGLDFYDVGASRGAGGLGIWTGGRLRASSNFARWRLLAEGPVRTVFELEYDNWDTGGCMFTETKRISLDAGSNLNRIESTFRSSWNIPFTLGIGIASRKNGIDWRAESSEGWLSYWGPVKIGHGRIGCAVILPAGYKSVIDDPYNRLVIADAIPAKPFIYYAGAAWNQSGDFVDRGAWETYIRTFARCLKQPLDTTITPPNAKQPKQP